MTLPALHGHLPRIEATKAAVFSGPDVVYVKLTRDVPVERRVTKMFMELSLEDARHLLDNLAGCIATAEGWPAAREGTRVSPSLGGGTKPA